MLQAHRERHAVEPRDATTRRPVVVFRNLDLGSLEIGIDTPILDTGVTSINLVRINACREEKFWDITVMTSTTTHTLAAAIEQLKLLQHDIAYGPIVTLQPNGSETPL